jgi:hypothetical protein
MERYIVFVIGAHDRKVLGMRWRRRRELGGGETCASPQSRRHTSSSGCPTMAVPHRQRDALLRRQPRPVRHASSRCTARSQTASRKPSSKPSSAVTLAYIHCRMLLRQIARWFDDYNESYPRSGLRMIAPGSSFGLKPRSRVSVKRGNTNCEVLWSK